VDRIAEYVFDDEFPAKEVLFCAVPSLDELPSALDSLSSHFVLFIAADATSIAEQTILDAGEKLLSAGMVYACVWGPDCERVHDLLDAAILKNNPSESDADVVITTWHSKDTIKEAVWFFMNCAWPAPAYEQACSSWVAAVIGSPEWEQLVREAILSGENS
jgi:hypothetical protein